MEFIKMLIKLLLDYAQKGNHPEIVQFLSKDLIEKQQEINKIMNEAKSETDRLKEENKSLLMRIKQLEEENRKLKEKLQKSDGIISDLKKKIKT